MPLPRVNVEPMQVDLPENEHREEVFVVDAPTLDLDVYASMYKGLAKLQRLLFVAKHCPSYAVDALRMSISAVKSTYNTEMYRDIMTKLADAANNEDGNSASDFDTHWVETTNKKAELKLEKLDQDLKTYKHNSIKESIRRGHDDLGDHYLDMGDFSNALKCYSRARDYCICAQHIVNMCMNVINVSIYMQNWSHVQTYVHKAEAVPDLFESTSSASSSNEKNKNINAGILARLKCAAGLSELSEKQYKAAAKLFLQVSFDHLDYPQVLSAHDVAIYGGLCALATFDRVDLQKKVLSSSSFKQFLELQPQLRDILHKFYASQYATCLDLLAGMKDNLLLDVYLSPHVDKLYSQIRNRALIQYFSPYVSADLSKMAASFNTSVGLLENELTQLILDGQISARIDSRKKVLYARDVDHRCCTFEKALEVGREYERRTKSLILRTVVLQHQIQLRVNFGGQATRDDDVAH
ncbi:COP9 signalosome complex subunit 1-like [Hydractinia symbiolongicarpus]|uniref:COP9 signalosome complex subunit 1-like n=1 Tax=Hydractinia symbiolongicarpus TaxID=13093 RepID=UPI00254A6E94|nr:COP9 signalosome complex subunit 1-like [Hydractinia symbiolongicarpus]